MLAFGLEATIRNVFSAPRLHVRVASTSSCQTTRTAADPYTQISREISTNPFEANTAPFQQTLQAVTAASMTKSAEERFTTSRPLLDELHPSKIQPGEARQALEVLGSIIKDIYRRGRNRYGGYRLRYFRALWATYLELLRSPLVQHDVKAEDFNSIIFNLTRSTARSNVNKTTDEGSKLSIPEVLEAMAARGLSPTQIQLDAIYHFFSPASSRLGTLSTTSDELLKRWSERKAFIISADQLSISIPARRSILVSQTLAEAEMSAEREWSQTQQAEMKEALRWWMGLQAEIVAQQRSLLACDFEAFDAVIRGERTTARIESSRAARAAQGLIRSAFQPGRDPRIDPLQVLQLLVGITRDPTAEVSPHCDPKAVNSALIRMAIGYHRQRAFRQILRIAEFLLAEHKGAKTTIHRMPLPPLSGGVYTTLLGVSRNPREFHQLLNLLVRAPRPVEAARANRSFRKILRSLAAAADRQGLGDKTCLRQLNEAFDRWGVALPRQNFLLTKPGHPSRVYYQGYKKKRPLKSIWRRR